MVRGVGIASLICSTFGCIWIVVGLKLIDGGEARLLWSVIMGVGVFLLIASIVLIVKPAEHDERRHDWTEVTKRLRMINAVQWSAIGLAILLLNILHHPSLLPWVISLLVGIHFLPMGYVVRLTSYKVLGISILCLDLAALALPPALRSGYTALGTGLSLLCAVAFWMTRVVPVWIRRSSSSVTGIRDVEGR